MIDKKILDQIIDSLEGTCETLGEISDRYSIDSDDLDIEDLKYIDEQIFECSNCNWWFETGTQDEDNKCEDCQAEEKNDQ